MMKVSWFQVIIGIGIISFLLFFVNILAGLSYQIGVSSDHIQEKLGVYFYLDDSDRSSDILYAEVIEMMELLENEGLEVTFYSKEDAFSLLAKRLPDVIGSLERYNIANPLPPTLYVLFDNQDEYEIMKTITMNYTDSIINLEDVATGLSFGEQEQRIAKVINMMNVLKYLSWFLIAVTVLIIITFLLYAIRINFFRFQKQLQVEKLLGASYKDIISPFLLYIGCILLFATMCSAGYIYIVIQYAHEYAMSVFSVSFYELLPSSNILVMYVVVQLLIMVLLNILFASGALWRLLRKV